MFFLDVLVAVASLNHKVPNVSSDCSLSYSYLQSFKRPKSLSNVTDHAGHESPSSEWSEVTFPPLSGGWSPPVFIRTKDPREEQRKQYEKDCR